jgi:hypothetical protein
MPQWPFTCDDLAASAAEVFTPNLQCHSGLLTCDDLAESAAAKRKRPGQGTDGTEEGGVLSRKQRGSYGTHQPTCPCAVCMARRKKRESQEVRKVQEMHKLRHAPARLYLCGVCGAAKEVHELRG